MATQVRSQQHHIQEDDECGSIRDCKCKFKSALKKV
jgi:hypothetical protein